MRHFFVEYNDIFEPLKVLSVWEHLKTVSSSMCRQHKGGLKSFTIWSSLRVECVCLRHACGRRQSSKTATQEDQETSGDLKASAGTDEKFQDKCIDRWITRFTSLTKLTTVNSFE